VHRRLRASLKRSISKEFTVANHKSALKRHRQSQEQRVRNRHYRATAKSSVRKVTDAIASGDAANGVKALQAASSTLSHVASKGVIPKNRAARKISRLAKRLSAATKA